MNVIQLIRPALEPQRDLELRMRESLGGLADFAQAMAPPTGWLSVEILSETADTEQTLPDRALSRA